MEHNHHSGEQHEGAGSNVVMVAEKKDRFLPISILVAAVLICGAIVFATFYKGGGGAPAATAPTTGAAPTVTNQNVMQLSSRDEVLGNSNAKVTMIEYGDFQCPFCGEEFFAQTEPLIIQNYVNTGKVKFVFRNFAFLGPESTAAAEADECATDQGQAWPYHNALYTAKVADDAKGGTEDDGFFTTAEFLKLAQSISGLDTAKFATCVNNNTDANLVATDKSNATAAGVNSTPTFYINGTQILGAQPYAQFSSALDAAIAAAK